MSKTIQFTDTSTNANTYFWDFGDGNTSTEKNPIHTYQDDGEYVVTHTVTNDFGEASIEQTVSLGDTQVDEDTQIDDTEPNPINPPFGYNPSQGELLTGTLSPQGQWYWDGYTWNTLEPNPINPPFEYLPPDNLLIDTLSPQGQWIWNGQVWNLNVGVDEEETVDEDDIGEEQEEEQFSFEINLTSTAPLGNTQAYILPNNNQINGDNPTISYEILSTPDVEILLNATPIQNVGMGESIFQNWQIISGDNFQSNTLQLSNLNTPQTILTINNEADSNNFGTIQIRANFIEGDDNDNGGNGGDDTGGNNTGGNSGAGRRKRGEDGGTGTYEGDDLVDPTGEGF